MLLQNEVEVEINIGNLGFFRKNFRPDLNIGDIINVPISSIKNSKVEVAVKCDYCLEEFKIKIYNHFKSTKKLNKNSCGKSECRIAKRRELEELGINNPNEKRAKTNLKKYGVEHPLQSKEILNKVKQTNLKRYGTENVFQSEEIKDKIKQHYLKNYGVEYNSQIPEVREKHINTLKERYGVENIMQIKGSVEKAKLTNIDRYGVEHPSQSEIYRKEKYKLAQDPNYVGYNFETKVLTFRCDRGEDHEYEISSKNYKGRKRINTPLCTVCNPIGSSSSIKQAEVLDYIKSLTDLEVINNYRDGLEIDIYIPELKLGFEFNGLYWHSEEYKEPNYHADKNKYFAEKGIRIIHVWEDEWDFKRDIICSQIQNLLGLSKKVYARNTKIQRIKNKDAREFLEEHHLQGGYRGIQISYGLFHKDELVSVMTFDSQEGRKQMPEDEYNLSRFCSKKGTVVIGGASKLLTAFCREQKPNRIISYADADWSNGGVYETLGFEKISHSRPDYKYVVDGVREHKSKYRKPKGEQRTEREIMEELGIPRVYDSGKIKYELKTQTTQNGKKNKKGR